MYTFLGLFLEYPGLTATLSNAPDKEVRISVLQPDTYAIVCPDVNRSLIMLIFMSIVFPDVNRSLVMLILMLLSFQILAGHL